jgi:sugar fermentation stimulation protein A
MKYQHIVKGTFLSRPNRFIAHVRINRAGNMEETVICHVKNTGRCRELLIPGVTVLLQFHPKASQMGRKTEYSLISVWKDRKEGPLLINMDSQAPNQAAYEWLLSIREQPPFLSKGIKLCNIKREVTYGQSRFDLAFQITSEDDPDRQQAIPAFMEVKGVTLEENGLSMFPDAPTKRGVKHIMELINAHQNGYESYLLFVIQMEGMDAFTPNKKTHKEFAQVLKMAEEKGVHILPYQCHVTENTLSLDQPVKYFIDP